MSDCLSAIKPFFNPNWWNELLQSFKITMLKDLEDVSRRRLRQRKHQRSLEKLLKGVYGMINT